MILGRPLPGWCKGCIHGCNPSGVGSIPTPGTKENGRVAPAVSFSPPDLFHRPGESGSVEAPDANNAESSIADFYRGGVPWKTHKRVARPAAVAERGDSPFSQPGREVPGAPRNLVRSVPDFWAICNGVDLLVMHGNRKEQR